MRTTIMTQSTPRKRTLIVCPETPSWLGLVGYAFDERNMFIVSAPPSPRLRMLDVDPDSPVGRMLLNAFGASGADAVAAGTSTVREADLHYDRDSWIVDSLARLAVIDGLSRLDFAENKVFWNIEDVVARHDLQLLVGDCGLVDVGSMERVRTEIARWTDPKDELLGKELLGWLEASESAEPVGATRGGVRDLAGATRARINHGAPMTFVIALGEGVKDGRGGLVLKFDPPGAATLRESGARGWRLEIPGCRRAPDKSQQVLVRLFSVAVDKRGRMGESIVDGSVVVAPLMVTDGVGVAEFGARLNPAHAHFVELLCGSFSVPDPAKVLDLAINTSSNQLALKSAHGKDGDDALRHSLLTMLRLECDSDDDAEKRYKHHLSRDPGNFPTLRHSRVKKARRHNGR